MQQVFERVEKKYLLTKDKMDLLLEKLQGQIKDAEYTNYTICNIYFDTDQFDLIRRSLDKPFYKEKVRLRSYGVPLRNSKVFLEVKKKYDGIVYKRRITLPLSRMEKYLKERKQIQKKNQVMKELDYLFDFYQLKPKVFLAYDRTAFVGVENEELRITFDHHIRSRTDHLSLKEGDQGTYLTDDSSYLMEIKVPGAFPLFLSHILTELEIYPVSFSKYGKVYQQMKREVLQNEVSRSYEKKYVVSKKKQKQKEEGVIYV